MRPIDADKLKELLLKERDAIPTAVIERYGFGVPTPYHHGESMRGGIRKALRCMEQTPTLTYADLVPHSRWVCLEPVIGYFACSECDHRILRAKCNFCPNCGAKMDKE